MQPIAHIRKTIFATTQAAFGAIAGVDQGTVCHWEGGRRTPDQEHMRRIRAEAVRLGKPWDDRWFFEVPAADAGAPKFEAA